MSLGVRQRESVREKERRRRSCWASSFFFFFPVSTVPLWEIRWDDKLACRSLPAGLYGDAASVSGPHGNGSVGALQRCISIIPGNGECAAAPENGWKILPREEVFFIFIPPIYLFFFACVGGKRQRLRLRRKKSTRKIAQRFWRWRIEKWASCAAGLVWWGLNTSVCLNEKITCTVFSGLWAATLSLKQDN